ncbi:MAG: DUF898 domain-containing protein [Bacteroidia bacterium]|nr:DUF898 domain-containing protein [Bacteroidia bacterium]
MEILSSTTTTSRVYPLSFTGKGSDYFGIAMVNLLLSILTLGLYYPWAKARELKYLYGATEFDGSRFEFHGSGKEMFRGFIKAVIIFTVVYGGLVAGIILNQLLAGLIWFYLGLLFLIPLAIHGSYKYRMSRSSWRGIRFGYRGKRNEFMWMFFRELFFTVISLGIYGAWMTIRLRHYVLGNIRFGDARFQYKGHGGDYFVLNIKGYFLSIVTLGIYLFWWQKELFAYYVDHLSLEHKEEKIQFKSIAGGGDFFALIMVNLLLMIFTLGIAYPWVMTRTLTFVFSKIQVTGNIDTAQLLQTESAYTDATGEDMSDMLDLGFVI